MKTLTGKTITIEIEKDSWSETSVRDLKEKIYKIKNLLPDKEFIPPKQQRIIFGGKELENANMLLRDCNIVPESTMFLVLKRVF